MGSRLGGFNGGVQSQDIRLIGNGFNLICADPDLLYGSLESFKGIHHFVKTGLHLLGTEL